jgi:hypothetical protein
MLVCALSVCCLLAAPASAQCSGGVCDLSGRPVLRAVSAPVRVFRFVRQEKPVRSFFANRQPLRRALRGVGSLFVR